MSFNISIQFKGSQVWYKNTTAVSIPELVKTEIQTWGNFGYVFFSAFLWFSGSLALLSIQLINQFDVLSTGNNSASGDRNLEEMFDLLNAYQNLRSM